MWIARDVPPLKRPTHPLEVDKIAPNAWKNRFLKLRCINTFNDLLL